MKVPKSPLTCACIEDSHSNLLISKSAGGLAVAVLNELPDEAYDTFCLAGFGALFGRMLGILLSNTEQVLKVHYSEEQLDAIMEVARAMMPLTHLKGDHK